MDRKDRSKKEKEKKVWSNAFSSLHSGLSSLATLEVQGHTKSQPAQLRKSFGLTYI